MANLTRFPSRMSDPFDEMFRGALRPWRWDLEATTPSIRVDVEENDKNYLVKADIPGVDKKDINVQVDGNIVTISAEVKKEKETKEGNRAVRSERYFGALERSFSLAQDVDEGKAEARYENGVLNLTLPKKASSASRRLTVS